MENKKNNKLVRQNTKNCAPFTARISEINKKLIQTKNNTCNR